MAKAYSAAKYDCTFGPDRGGQYIEEIVPSQVADHCGTFCTCIGLTDNTCLFGPDDKGHFFMDNAVPSEEVDACDNEN